MEEITLSLIPTGVQPICHVSQNDNERLIKINLVDSGLAYPIKTGDVIRLYVRKPNSHVISTSVSSTVGNTYVMIAVTDDMCNVNGNNLCELRITNDNTRIGTSNFTMVVEADPTNNRSGDASSLSELSDVELTDPTNNQVLKYDSSSQKWKNGTGGGGGASSLEDLDDVEVENPENNQVLKYDEVNHKWVNSEGGGSSGDHITLTQAEYDALVQAGTVDPDAYYFISDAPFPSYAHNYSTNEKIVGTWVDGSPVYEKTVYSAGGVLGNFSIPHNISNIDRVLSYSGTVKDSNFSQYGDIWVLPRIAAPVLGIDSVTVTDIKIVNPSDSSTRLIDWYITIRYTKTS